MVSHVMRATRAKSIPAWAAKINALAMDIMGPDTQPLSSSTSSSSRAKPSQPSSVSEFDAPDTSARDSHTLEGPPMKRPAKQCTDKRLRVSSGLPAPIAPAAAAPIAPAATSRFAPPDSPVRQEFDDLATLAPSRFLNLDDFHGTPAINEAGVISGFAPPASAPRPSIADSEPSPPPQREQYQPAVIVSSGFQTRRGAFVQMSDGLRVFSTTHVRTTDNDVFFSFDVAGTEVLYPVYGLTSANLNLALNSIVPKYSASATAKKHLSLFDGVREASLGSF